MVCQHIKKKRQYSIVWRTKRFKYYLLNSWNNRWLMLFLDLFSFPQRSSLLKKLTVCYWRNWSVLASQSVHLTKKKKLKKTPKLISLSVVGWRQTVLSTCRLWRMKQTSRPPAPKESRVCRTPKCSLASSQWPDQLWGWCGHGAGDKRGRTENSQSDS